jgi:hypothetical protein
LRSRWLSDRRASASGAAHCLVIGNAQYSGNLLQPLKNPISDAKLMAATLRKAGFKVLVAENAGLREMKIAIGDFGAGARRGRPSATGCSSSPVMASRATGELSAADRGEAAADHGLGSRRLRSTW